jgi:PTS system N-acetylglucosamine-specific IIC component
LANDSLVSEPALRTLGARGIVRPAQNVMQVVIGPQAEIVAGEIRDALTGEEYAGISAVDGKPFAALEGVKTVPIARSHSTEVESGVADRLLDAFGGIANVQKAEHVAVTRLRFVLRDGGKADSEALERSGAAGLVKASDSVWHVIAGHQAAAVAAAVRAKLDSR